MTYEGLLFSYVYDMSHFFHKHNGTPKSTVASFKIKIYNLYLISTLYEISLNIKYSAKKILKHLCLKTTTYKDLILILYIYKHFCGTYIKFDNISPFTL